ncbi:ComEC/Rec2 family competence protein [Leucobacter salsicius]|uniref:ComEC/Rec2 family competence protein n=1 Tax=Leucobacter salsicius TaxID=664638 RepID=UPI000A054168|nr:ComEC/Rec2 family competence protein [Leucobacter salsicius]
MSSPTRSVSGANCALVTSAAIWALSWLGCGRRLRVVAAALALLLFVLVVGPDASVQRAAIMGAVLLASSYGGKRSVALPALGLAIAVLLIIDPWQAWHPGFALSVAATGGIILCTPALSEALRRLGGIPRWIALPIAVAAAAQLACGPLLLLLQDGLPAAGVLANVLAGPAAPAGTALGLAALVAGPVSYPLAHALVAAASLPARWVEATARVASELPGARWDWLPGVPGALLLLATQTLAVAAWMLATGRITRSGTRVRTPWRPDTLGPRGLRVGVAVLAGCAAGVFVGPTLVAPTVQRAGVPADWRVIACDVGQGDAILLRGPTAGAGEAMLIDTGDDETLLRACLRTFGVTRITLLVLTHDDRDHVGALAAAAPLADAALVAPATIEDAGPGRDVTRQLERAEVPWQEGGSGDVGATAGVDWVLLAPDRRVAPATSNGASLVMHANAGDVTALMLADTGEPEQAQLASVVSVQQLAADVVKVAHHGSRDQQLGFYDHVRAELGLVSVGAENGYGHPARDTLQALMIAGTTTLRTDQAGSIAVLGRDGGENGGGALRVWAQRGRAVGGDQ